MNVGFEVINLKFYGGKNLSLQSNEKHLIH